MRSGSSAPPGRGSGDESVELQDLTIGHPALQFLQDQAEGDGALVSLVGPGVDLFAATVAVQRLDVADRSDQEALVNLNRDASSRADQFAELLVGLVAEVLDVVRVNGLAAVTSQTVEGLPEHIQDGLILGGLEIRKGVHGVPFW